MELDKKILEAKKYIENYLDEKPDICLILGSGLGVLGEKAENQKIVDYSNIPHFPVSTIEGHKSRFVFGRINNIKVAIMQGRFHFYEGYSMKETAFPVWVMKSLGVNKLIVTNAAGGINTSYRPGDLMLIKDHINFMFTNPLIGPNLNSIGTRFPDMSNAYSYRMREIVKNVSDKLNIPIKEGVYASMTGPSYETPAEIRMLRILGADAVGMSTVPEVIAANHAEMEVIGISCITNMAAGVLDKPLNHQEVIKTAEEVKEKFIKLVTGIISEI
ncbi:purine-nucleoside phosphorylase [Lutispora thermophila]|nr:purine-nucleoside phosphorylase [Lutispora thermophila]